VVRVVAGVEVVVVQGAVEPVVEELDGADVQQHGHHQPLGVPPRQTLRRRQRRVHHVEQQRRQQDLVVPAPPRRPNRFRINIYVYTLFFLLQIKEKLSMHPIDLFIDYKREEGELIKRRRIYIRTSSSPCRPARSRGSC
jgi:hypothetical protein